MNITPTEFQEGRTLAQYLDILVMQGKVIVYTHANQETYTKSMNQKMKAKVSGVRPGLPDYIIITNHKVLFVELKRLKGSRLSEAQEVWLKAIGVGHKRSFATVAYGFEGAKEFIDSHLDL